MFSCNPTVVIATVHTYEVACTLFAKYVNSNRSSLGTSWWNDSGGGLGTQNKVLFVSNEYIAHDGATGWVQSEQCQTHLLIVRTFTRWAPSLVKNWLEQKYDSDGRQRQPRVSINNNPKVDVENIFSQHFCNQEVNRASWVIALNLSRVRTRK